MIYLFFPAVTVMAPEWISSCRRLRGRWFGHGRLRNYLLLRPHDILKVESLDDSSDAHGHLSLVLFLPRPQNRARKCLHNLRTFKPRRVNITSSPWTLDTICVA
jgi:hypothetical protein